MGSHGEGSVDDSISVPDEHNDIADVGNRNQCYLRVYS